MKSKDLPLPLEHDSQVAVIDWCNAHVKKWPCLEFIYAVPNAGKRSYSGAEYMKAEGLKAGVPDLCLPYPKPGAVGYFDHAGEGEEHIPPPIYYCCGLYIEMKRKPKKVSPEQIKWINYLRSAGYKTAVAWSADEAIEIIKEYLADD